MYTLHTICLKKKNYIETISNVNSVFKFLTKNLSREKRKK